MGNDWNEFVPWLDIENIEQVLNTKISILDLLDRFGIEHTQNKTRCLWHADGNERTPSLVFYPDTNTFHCFGCGRNGGLIDLTAKQLKFDGAAFGSLAYNKSVEELCKIAGISTGENIEIVPVVKRPPEETVEFYVEALGYDIREYLKTKTHNRDYKEWCSWAQTHFDKMDKMFDLDDDKWEKVKRYCDRVRKEMK